MVRLQGCSKQHVEVDKQAEEKAIAEYRKYQVKTLSPVEQAYMDSIKTLTAKISKEKGGEQ